MSKKVKTQFASESVCSGHPDKVADAISDAILDAVLASDPNGRVAVETLASHDHLTLAGEVTTTAKVDFVAIAREKIRELGYIHPEWGFSDQSLVDCFIHEQSPEISVGVDDFGAGDQGLMFGYACDETKELLPLPITLAHRLTHALDDARESGRLPHLRPDGKAQVVVNYLDGKPHSIEHVTVAVPHHESLSLERIKKDVYEQIVSPILSEYGYAITPKDLVVNGTGVWHLPGPSSDAGLTGRKIVVDTYGGYARVGGGAFSGKDPSKVDRSGAYAARFLAKNIVAKGYAKKCEIGLAYFIGAREPVQFSIDTFGTEIVNKSTIERYARNLLDLSVKGIIEGLDLRKPIYSQTSAYGHFGKAGLPWEKVVSSTS
jgi:S-adenosylmethionine synthetase